MIITNRIILLSYMIYISFHDLTFTYISSYKYYQFPCNALLFSCINLPEVSQSLMLFFLSKFIFMLQGEEVINP